MFFPTPDHNINEIHGKTYLQWATEAVVYARTQCPLGAANNQLDILRAKQVKQQKELLAKTAEWQAATNIRTGAELATMPMTIKDVYHSAEKASEIRASNCVGLSCLAYQYLIENKITPIEMINFQDGNHMLILLGRNSQYPPVLSEETGLKIDACVICDPWANKVYRSDEFDRERYITSSQGAIGEIKKISLEMRVDINTAKEMYVLKYVVPMFDYLEGLPRICLNQQAAQLQFRNDI